MVSHETRQMEEMAQDLKDFDAVATITEDLGDAALPTHLWPLMGQLFAASSYGKLHNTAYEACKSLNTLGEALGETLSAVAGDYRNQEQQYGEDFSHVDD